MPITSSSAMTTITAAMAAPAIFSALMSTFQTGQTASNSAAPAGACGSTARAYPGKGMRLKEAKNNPGVLQSYVTYDTLPGGGYFASGLRGRFGTDLEGITMSKQAEFAVILKMNPMFADLGADELQRISGLCHTQQLASARCCSRRAMPAMRCSGSAAARSGSKPAPPTAAG